MEPLIKFLEGMVGTSPVEWIAIAFALANITLLVRRSIWNYPFGIVMVTLYAWIFFGAKLYGQSALQAVYFSVQVYGWMQWYGKRDGAGHVIVRKLDQKIIVAYAIVALIGFVLLSIGMKTYTDAAAPVADAFITVVFVSAQLMLAQRYLENWLLWVFGDVFAIGLYWSQGLHPTAALYLVFLVFSVIGFFEWRKAYRTGAAI